MSKTIKHFVISILLIWVLGGVKQERFLVATPIHYDVHTAEQDKKFLLVMLTLQTRDFVAGIGGTAQVLTRCLCPTHFFLNTFLP